MIITKIQFKEGPVLGRTLKCPWRPWKPHLMASCIDKLNKRTRREKEIMLGKLVIRTGDPQSL